MSLTFHLRTTHNSFYVYGFVLFCNTYHFLENYKISKAKKITYFESSLISPNIFKIIIQAYSQMYQINFSNVYFWRWFCCNFPLVRATINAPFFTDNVDLNARSNARSISQLNYSIWILFILNVLKKYHNGTEIRNFESRWINICSKNM